MKTIVDYAEKVKAQHALNKTLAPVETDLTDASQAYAIGDQFIYDGVLYKAKTAIAQHDALVLNTNYEAADDITTQIKNKTVTTDPVPTEGSSNPVQSNGVYVENRNIYEVMGHMGAKNLIPFPHDVVTETKAGITFTENADGSITVNGTATDIARHLVTSKQFKAGEKYILSGCPSGGAHSQNGTYTLYTQTINNYDDGEGVEFTWNASITGITIAVYTGVTVDNLTFYPMLRLSSDTDSTYQPYAKTNKQLTAENEALTNNLADEVSARAKLGAHNLGIKLKDGVTSIGLTIKDAPDGGNYVNGTATSSGGRLNLRGENFVLKAGAYTIVGESNDHSKYSAIILHKTSDSSVLGTYEISDGVVNKSRADFTLDADTECFFGFNTNTDTAYGTDTFIIYPMVRLADDKNDTFYPYAKTNRELTAENQTLTNYANAQSNPNLLDNPFFTVNQRGEDSYSASTSYTYTIDRWLLYNATLSKITKGVRYTAVNNSLCVLRQFIENVDYLDGEKVTLSAIINNELRVLSGTFFKNNTNLSQAFVLNNGSFALQLIMGSNDTYARVVLASYTTENLDIKAFKLELGEVSTLAIDTAPNYSLELLKCQRYFVRYLMPDNSGAPLGIGFYSSTTNARLSLTLPIEMRAKPSVNISDISKFKVIVDSVAKVTSAVTVSGVFQNIITLNFTTDNATQYAIATLNRTTQGEYIDLSADL